MKKLILTLALAVAAATASAQKFALIDTEYILKNVPAYERASEQLNQISRKWQAEVETLSKEAETLAKNYESESVYLSEEQKTAKIQEVFDKENVVIDRATAADIIYASPKIDISNDVLDKMGYGQ